MKQTILFLAFLLSGFSLLAQEKMYIHKSDKMTLGAPVAATDSIYFSSNQTTALFRIGDTLVQYPISTIDSIIFGPDSDTVFVTYNGTSVSVTNPLAFEGVAVTVQGADVTVNSSTETQDIYFCLAGTTSNGMFKIYSAKRFNLLLNGVNITNTDGPPLNVQSEKKCSVKLMTGKANTLTDGVTYATPPGNEEQSGTFFSEAKLLFSGSGSLVINSHGSEQHGLCSDNEIEVNAGVITVTSAAKDGIHAGNGIVVAGGTLTLTPTGDGIDGDVSTIAISGGNIAITCNTEDVQGLTADSGVVVSGGNIDITMNGDQSKAIKSDFPVTLSGGTIDIVTTGDVVLEESGSGYKPSYCTAIRSEKDITISGAAITIHCSGTAGGGISSDANISMTSGSISITSTGNGGTYYDHSGDKDAYVSTCFLADGSLSITGGSVTTSSSGTGGKGLSADGEITFGTVSSSPEIHVTTTGAKILISGSGPNADYAEAKAVKSDAAVHVTNGTIVIASADDGIKSDVSIEFGHADVTISNSVEGIEAPSITMNGDTLRIWSSDDCINATFGGGGEANDGSLFTMAGGYLMTNSTGGDGIDSNGSILFSNGTTVVHGPQSAPEVGMDYNGTCNMNGGFLVISGTNSNMTQAPSTSSGQYSVKVMMNQSQSSSTLFHIQDALSNNVLTFQPCRSYYSIVFSSSSLQNGGTYSIYTGGTSTGTNLDGLYTGGTYAGGTFRKSFTISSKVTNVTF